jgi:hypothetical protein
MTHLAVQRLQESTGTAATPQEHREAFTDPASISTRMEAVHHAFRAAFPSSMEDEGPYNFVEEVYEDTILARVNEETVRIPYTYSQEGAAGPNVEFGDPEKVTVAFTITPVEEAAGADDPEPEHFRADGLGGTILESVDGAEEGRVWRVTMVRPGISKNGRRYRPEVLREAAALYEGARSFDGHRDPAERKRSSVAGMTGWHENVQIGPDGALTSDFHIAESREDIRQLFLTAWRNQRPDLIGFSHDVSALTENVLVDRRRISDVRKIVEVHSVDVVADPSAGGQIERLVASRQEGGPEMELQEFLRALRAGELTEAQLTEAYEAHPEWEAIAEAIEEERAAATAAGAGDDPEPEPVRESEQPLTRTMRTLTIEAAGREHNLPQAAVQRLTETLGEDVTEAEIFTAAQETASIWDAALAARPSPLPGQGGVAVVQEEREKLQHALDGMILGEVVEGQAPFRSVKEAYSAFTGTQPYTYGSEEDFNRKVFAEAVGAYASFEDARRLTESLTTASWAEALGDSIRRALIREYQSNAYSSWRQIVSDVGNPIDFRTNRRVRIGGYDVLPTVAESGAYTALTSPTDEEATYAVSKKGGTEDYTLEMVANDDLGGLRRIPRNLGRAAALTLYRAIWNTTIAGNATIYDTDALFDDVAHDNDNATTPLAEAGISLLRQRMIRQTQPGETSGFVGLMPRFIVVPPELYVTAYKLAESAQAVVSGEDATTPNPFRGMVVIEVPTFTDANDWYLIADPATVPTIEVGFYQGRQDPELLIQDQPAVGSVFTNDEFTWKIRHIWGLTVLDFRGFQRATNT